MGNVRATGNTCKEGAMKTNVVPLSEKKHYIFWLKTKEGNTRYLTGSGTEYSGFTKLVIEEVRKE